MASDYKPTNKELMLSTPISSQLSQLRIRPNMVSLKPIRFYVPENDYYVPSAFALGGNAIFNANGQEEALLSGYFSALCAVLPDLTGIAQKIMASLGFRAQEIMVPSQTTRMGIVIPQLWDLKIRSLKLAQMAFLPFQVTYDGRVAVFWDNVASTSGIKYSFSTTKLCSEADMEAISWALRLSGRSAELKSSIALSLQAFAATSTPLAHVLATAAGLNRQHVSPIYAKEVNDVKLLAT